MSLGLGLTSHNVVAWVEPYGEAAQAGVLVGDVVRELNGQKLPPKQKLFERLEAEFVVAGDEVTLGLTRTLARHMEEVERKANAGYERLVPPDSPRMRARLKIDYEARMRDYRQNPQSRGYYRYDAALGGAAGRML